MNTTRHRGPRPHPTIDPPAVEERDWLAQERALAPAGGDRRDALLAQALQRVKDGYYYIPLHHQIRPWAMRKGVETVHRADDRPMPIWTTIK